jgi:hypothetical protein
MILEDRLAKGCDRTAWFVRRQYARKHGPREALAKGFAQLLDMEKVRALRFGQPAEPVPPPSPPPTSVHAAVADADAARRLRAKPDPIDAAAWRLAGTLRRQMLGEQVLFAAAAPKPVEEIVAAQAAQVEAAPAPQPKLNRAQRRRQEKLKKARPAKPQPAPPAAAPEAKDSDAAFRERAIRTFAATFAAAPPHLRDALDRLTPQQRLALIERCWPEGEEFDESPQGP